MASQPIPMEPKYIIDLVIKKRWIVLIPFSLAMIVGIYLAIELPRIYEARTLILIQPQKVPEEYVQSIVTSDASSRISTLSQQILSRTNMEKIIEEFDLFAGPEFEDMYVEDKIKFLRDNISVAVSNDSRRDNDAFTISYQGKDPDVVMKVTNALASFFIDENLKLREAQAVGTSDFLEAELQNMKQRLEEVEEQLKRYRESNMGKLPEQLESNLQILDRLQEHLGDSQQGLAEAKIRLATLQNEAALTRNQSAAVVVAPDGQETTNDIDQMKAQLESLLSRYTERHPDVVAHQERIAELERQAQANAQSAIEEGGDVVEDQPQPVSPSPEYRVQYTEISQEIRRLEVDIADTRDKIEVYQQRVEDTPRREQELMSLNRDYQNIQSTYDSLLNRKLEAEIAVNMERKQKGEQFRILDPAKRPQKPVKPDMRKLFIMVVGAGLAVGAGIIFILEYLDSSFKRPEDIEADLGLPVLCSVPRIVGRGTRILRGIEYAFFSIVGVIALVLFAGFASLTQRGVEPTLELVNKIASWV